MTTARRDDWLGLYPDALPVEEAIRWATLPSCGATVAFTGSVRDHSEGRDGVTELSYEAWQEQVGPVMESVAAEARVRWPGIGRVVVLHRTGELRVGEAAVLVVASAPHRDEAFHAARHLIDETKARAPIWKKETWSGGQDWSEPGHCNVAAAT